MQNGNCVFVMPTSLTIYDVCKVFNDLPQPLPHEISLVQTTELDSSGVQLLLAIYIELKSVKKQLIIVEINADVIDVLELFNLPFGLMQRPDCDDNNGE
jgi:ABC-type transporter Mla MlaB component